jgi:hypothetical protein
MIAAVALPGYAVLPLSAAAGRRMAAEPSPMWAWRRPSHHGGARGRSEPVVAAGTLERDNAKTANPGP